MGTSKQLLQLGNKTVIRHCVDTLADAGIGQIVVVCGAKHDACAQELQGAGMQLVRNEAQNSQMADSARIGLRALDETSSGVIVCLVDHPLVTCSTYQAIIDAHARSPEKIIIPAFQGKRGHPSLFPFDLISDLFFLPTLRDLIRENNDQVLMVDVPDEGTILDMDTREDYLVIAEKFAKRADSVPAEEHHVHRA
jgi:molybdenum cofactor cytidylyltransferase